MPEISRFYGIIVRLYDGDHPPAHMHVRYGDHEAAISLDTLRILQGTLPKRAHALVRTWALRHRDALHENWQRVQAHEPPLGIAPLE